MTVDDRFAHLNPKTCVVVGGRGFLGRSLVLRLLKLGNWIVRIADSAHSLQLHHSESILAQALSSARASYFHIDLTDKCNIVKGPQSFLLRHVFVHHTRIHLVCFQFLSIVETDTSLEMRFVQF